MSFSDVRRSSRLIEAGYYKEDGTPNLSYRERLYRVFKRRSFIYEDDDDSISSYSSEDGGNNYFGDYVRDFLQNQRNTSDDRDDGDSELIPLLVRDIGTQTEEDDLVPDDVVPEAPTTQTVQQELKTFQVLDNNVSPWSDRMPNFALESQGARILSHLSSETYWPRDKSSYIWDKLTHWWYSQKKQRTVIQGHEFMKTGECWPIAGDQGHLFISLSHPINVTHVTLGHIPKRQTPHGHIQSAPREFSVHGFKTTKDDGIFLGGHVYDEDGAPHQTFTMPDPKRGVFKYVKLVVESNWGSIDHTCIYDFRVHGKPPFRFTCSM